ncbi:MAG: hypothetical protein H0X56_09885 [Solirubrobacterales bacterium]|nr:hypothetical protein [Solirubrobacterales bacterium]
MTGPDDPEAHRTLMLEAMELEADGQRRLLAGETSAGRQSMSEAADRYRASWARAPQRAYGRAVGMLKAAVIAGGGVEEAAHARRTIGEGGDSASSWYALGIAALVDGDDDLARRATEAMRDGGEAFTRAADAIAALADRDDDAYASALRSILDDFEQRTEHLTGVAFADTPLMLDLLAERRGMAVRPASELLPPG